MKTTKWTDFEGFALVPSLIRGSMRTVNVLARPHEDLSAEVPVRKMHADEEWARAESYLQSTDFGEKAAGRIANTRTRRIESGPGDFREDKQDGEPSRKLLDSQPSDGSRSIQKGERRLTEAIIREADRVILAGVYDAARQGIAPDPDDITRPYRLVVSGETSLKHKVHNRMIGISVAGTLAIVSAGV